MILEIVQEVGSLQSRGKIRILTKRTIKREHIYYRINYFTP